MGDIGRWTLIFALVICTFAIFANITGLATRNRRWLSSGRNAVVALSVLTTIASGSLIYLLVTGDYTYQYVSQYSGEDMALFYKIAAFWGGNAGSLLLWFWILSIYTTLAVLSKHKDSDQYSPWVSIILLIINLFFATLLNFISFPFAQNPTGAVVGSGLNPMLQNPGMAVHPVTLYLGYIGLAIPFAYGMAALILKKADSVWLKVTRRWTLVSWLFLSMGIFFGSQWAYVELGWGGYWTWDPVENASLLPWLTGTAFLHSAMVQEKKGMLKGWNIVLVTITFVLTLFGTFLTRSGVLWSVHAFANGPIASYFLAFIGIVIAGSLALIILRLPLLKTQVQFEAVVSKESSFLLNNLLLLGSAFTVFWGTMYPIISEVFTGDKVTVNAPYFNRVNVPIFITVVILMGICPLIAWRKSSLKAIRKHFAYPLVAGIFIGLTLFIVGIRGWLALLAITSASFVFVTIFLEFILAVRARVRMTGEYPLRSFFMLFVKNRRRYGGYIVHIAIILMVIGFTGAGAYTVEQQRGINPGETMAIGPYTLEYRGLEEELMSKKSAVYAEFLVSKNGKEIGVIRPKKEFYANGGQPTTEVSIISYIMEDFYVVLDGWVDETQLAVIQVKIIPLIIWVWIGGYGLILGTLISLWPERNNTSRARYRMEMQQAHV